MYQDAQQLEPSLTTVEQLYENLVVLFNKDSATTNPTDYLTFQSMRVTDRFEKSSHEMLMVLDKIAMMQQKPADNYEY